MSSVFVMASDNSEIKRHHSFEDAVHFCLDFMINPTCNAPETLIVMRYSALPEQCQRGKSKVNLINSMVFLEGNVDGQRFCVVVETDEEVDLRELRDMVMCVITFLAST